MKVLATYNIKGGVGKTATAVNLAYLAAAEGARTLVWDLDPQGAASFYFRVKPKVKGGSEALITGRRALDRAIKGTDYDNLDLIPADFSYRNMDLELGETKKRTRRIDLLHPAAGQALRLRLPRLPAEHLAGERERLPGGRRAARAAHPDHAVAAHLRPARRVPRGEPRPQEAAGHRLLLDGRQPQDACTASWSRRSRADRPDVLDDPDPGHQRHRAHGRAPPAPRVRPPVAVGRAYRALWAEILARL